MSSLGYNSRLTKGAYKGKCGMPEKEESSTSSEFFEKVDKVVKMLKSSKSSVVLTGAGISTSCGIPDFRGPQGVWTKEGKKGKEEEGKERKDYIKEESEVKKRRIVKEEHEKPLPLPTSLDGSSVPFDEAIPSFSHFALAEMMGRKLVDFVVTQNVDGLHYLSGVPRQSLAEMHGCILSASCEGSCREGVGEGKGKREVEVRFRKDLGGMGLKKLSETCPRCGGDLYDKCVDWCSPLPSPDWPSSEAWCRSADVLLVLGTSLQMEPFSKLPERALRRWKTRGKGKNGLVLCNLQETHLDKKASKQEGVLVDEGED